MSRIGKKPIALPKGVTITVHDQELEVKGPKGTLKTPIPAGVSFKVDGEELKGSWFLHFLVLVCWRFLVAPCGGDHRPLIYIWRRKMNLCHLAAIFFWQVMQAPDGQANMLTLFCIFLYASTTHSTNHQ